MPYAMNTPEGRAALLNRSRQEAVAEVDREIDARFTAFVKERGIDLRTIGEDGLTRLMLTDPALRDLTLKRQLCVVAQELLEKSDRAPALDDGSVTWVLPQKPAPN